MTMPFIVYFFLSLLIIYIPTPTLLLFFQKTRLAAWQSDGFQQTFSIVDDLAGLLPKLLLVKKLQSQKSALPLFSLCQCLRMADPLLSLFTIWNDQSTGHFVVPDRAIVLHGFLPFVGEVPLIPFYLKKSIFGFHLWKIPASQSFLSKNQFTR